MTEYGAQVGWSQARESIGKRHPFDLVSWLGSRACRESHRQFVDTPEAGEIIRGPAYHDAIGALDEGVNELQGFPFALATDPPVFVRPRATHIAPTNANILIRTSSLPIVRKETAVSLVHTALVQPTVHFTGTVHEAP